jgi:hypothetical protein
MHYERWRKHGDALWIPPLKPTIEDVFWAGVLKTDTCWLWQLGGHKLGYGEFRYEGIRHRTHIYSWELANGRSVPKGLVVRHTCDNPPCVRPDHLLIGSQAQNLADGVMRERWPHGERHHHARLTADLVLDARQQANKPGFALNSLARQLSVDTVTLLDAVRGKTWRHLNDREPPVTTTHAH